MRYPPAGKSPRLGEGTIEPFKQRFVELLARHEVIRFGEFILKSGRVSPYFIDAGQLRTGAAIAGLGEAYAAQIRAARLECDLVFGPSYKGIPLAVATAMAMASTGTDVAFAFDRKELKDHGEGGRFVGTLPESGMRVVVVDDVITSGASIRQSVKLLRQAAHVRISAVVVAVDRQERGEGDKTTLAELQDRLEIAVLPIVTIRDIVRFLSKHTLEGPRLVDEERRRAIEAYLEEYGG